MSQIASITEARAVALLGESPRVTLVDGNDADACLTVRLARDGKSWLGIVDDGAALLDRIRMGLVPRFVVHPDASTSTVSGELVVRIVGRASEDPRAALLPQPFGLGRAVLIEVVPRALVLEALEPSGAVSTGAVPRT